MRRSKKFFTYDSLRFERVRLETFIDWPVSWLNPEDLARDGFYFLRTKDHCACIYCRGIVGAWEVGDTARNEHKRHFPHCPFIRGNPVGNIPIEIEVVPSEIDVCGKNNSGPPFSEPECKDFLSYESRLESYNRWPELVTQKPQELAEAGFFYCGLSDHVRCFHCGNGLRNWEAGDRPWDEHAFWYPECTYVRLKKGQEFIDKQGKPSESHNNNVADLEPLMRLDIMRAVLGMGFPADKVKAALQRKLERTGLPFFGLEPCIEGILQYMEEETRRTLHERAAAMDVVYALKRQGRTLYGFGG